MKTSLVVLLLASSFTLNGIVSEVLDTAADVVHGATDTARDIADDTLDILEPRRRRAIVTEAPSQPEEVQEVTEVPDTAIGATDKAQDIADETLDISEPGK